MKEVNTSPVGALYALTCGSIAILLAAGAGRLAQLEYTRGAELREQAEKQQQSTITIAAQRGSILDARGRVLAGSARRPSVYVEARKVADPRFAAYSVAPALGLDPAELERTIAGRHQRGFVWVQRGVSEEAVQAFKEVRAARRLNTFALCYEPERVYPFGRLAAHVLGFVGAEQCGLAGLEQSFDSVLKGKDGRRSSTVDVFRRRVGAADREYVPPRDGDNLVLTIDAHIQQRTEYHLANAVEEFKAEWGVAVVMDPQSGEVLAMAVKPDFDPSAPIPAGLTEKQTDAARERLRNRAVSDSYEPGSMFKPFVASSAFADGRVRLDEVFAIHGPTHSFGRRVIHDTHAYDVLTMAEVISKSSNIGMGMLGARVGNERLHHYVEAFGFGQPTGIRLPGEHPGQLNPLARWTSYSTQSVPIGQEIAVTPIQAAAAFSALANDGTLYQPRIVRGIVGAQGNTVADFSEPIRVRQVLDPTAARQFRLKALAAVVSEGTGKNAALPDYQVFGKTGTAQIARQDRRGYVPGKYVGSFVGGAPAENPRAVVVVSLFGPSGKYYYGGTVSAPAAGAILADTLAYMQIPPSPPVTPTTGMRPAASVSD